MKHAELLYTAAEQKVVDKALGIISKYGIAEDVDTLGSPQAVKRLVKLRLGGRKREAFCVLFLTAQHGLIEAEDMFHGTIDGAAVYPREVARRALELSAAAVILAHNHPSGNADPSQADKQITTRLVDALGLFDIRVLDHIIVGNGTFSFAEAGLI